MFQGLLENLIKSLIGEYVEEIDSKKLNLSVYSGIIDLNDLKLKKNLFCRVNIPIELVVGHIKKLYVRVPWNALSSKPVQFEIDGVYLLVNPLYHDRWEEYCTKLHEFEYIQQQLMNSCLETFKSQLKQALYQSEEQMQREAEQQQGFFVKLTSKILDNIQVSMKNIHFRYEDCHNNYFSMGLTLQKLEIETINDNDESEFIDRTLKQNKLKALRKKINLCNIGLYAQQNDLKDNMISLIDGDDCKLQSFHHLFQSDEHMSSVYKEFYISQPLKCVTKLKQLSEQQIIQFRQSRYQQKPNEIDSNQLNKIPGDETSMEPIYQVHLDIEQVDVCILKSQSEAIFRIVEHLTEFQRYTDNFLGKRAIKLSQFYSSKQDVEQTKLIFEQCLIKQIRRQVSIYAFEGKKIPEDQMQQIDMDAILDQQQSLIYESILKFENKVKLNKWSVQIVKDNFEQFKSIVDARKTEEDKQRENTIVGQIGSNLAWLSSGAYSYMPSIYSSNQQQITERPQNEVEDQQFQDVKNSDVNENQSETTSFKDALADDEFEDAIDYPDTSNQILSDSLHKEPIQSVHLQKQDSENLKIHKKFSQTDQFSQSAIEQVSQSQNADNTSFVTATGRQSLSNEQILEKLSIALIKEEQSFIDFMDDFRTATRPMDKNRDGNIPIFRGTFNLKKSKVALKIDSNSSNTQERKSFSDLDEGNASDDSFQNSNYFNKSSGNENLNEVIMYSSEFVIEYNHYDALNLNNAHQVTLNAQCKNMGVYLINQAAHDSRKYKAANENVNDSHELINLDQELEPEDNNQSNCSDFETKGKPIDVIYKMVETKQDIMQIEIKFGNQNIKEQQISNMQSTNDFIDSEINFQFKPIVFIYRQEFMQLIHKFMEINQCISDNVKLRALEIQEQMYENLSLQNVIDTQIQSVQKIRVQLDSSKIILPINNKLYSKGNDCWIIDTGNMIINNEKDQFTLNNQKKQNKLSNDMWKCDQGYNPFNLDISDINMIYSTNMKDLTFIDDGTYRHKVLRDLNIQILIMIRDQSKNLFKKPLQQPLVKLKVFADELNVVFTPITYLHIVNISKCLQVQGNNSKESEQAIVQERLRLFDNAKAVELVKMKAQMNLISSSFLAVISGSYIYFFDTEAKEQIKFVMQFIQQLYSKKKWQQKAQTFDDQQFIQKKKFEYILKNKRVYQALKLLEYKEYYLLKGCQNVLSVEQYKQQIIGRRSLSNQQEDHNLNSLENREFQRQINENHGSIGYKQQLRLLNSMQFECILHFESTEKCKEWKQLIKSRAFEINQQLGKSVDHSYSKTLQNESKIYQNDMVNQPMETENYLQILQVHDLQFNKIEIILQGQSKIELNGSLLKSQQKDCIILSAQQSKQFNRTENQKNQQENLFNAKWCYSIIISQLTMKNTKRLFDNDLVFGISSLKVIQKSNFENMNNTNVEKASERFPMVLKTIQNQPNNNVKLKYSKGNLNQNSISLIIKNQSLESPRYANCMMDMEINVCRIHFDWNPISINRVLRFLRFCTLVEDMVDTESLRLKQSFKIALENKYSKKKQFEETNFKSNDDDIQKQNLNDDNEQSDKFLRSNSDSVAPFVDDDELSEQGDLKETKQNDQKSFLIDSKIAINNKDKSKFEIDNQDKILNTFKRKETKKANDIEWNQESDINKNENFNFDQTPSRIKCTDDPTILMRVKVSIEKIDIVCIHPQNDSYPIITKKIDKMELLYDSMFDHDVFNGNIGNFRVFDNTNYPLTLDAHKVFQPGEKVPKYLLLGFRFDEIKGNQVRVDKKQQNDSHVNNETNENQVQKKQEALKFKIIYFHYPEDLSCPIQRQGKNRQYDKLVEIEFQQLQLNYMQELIFRLNDYFFYQFIYAFTDIYPYEEIYNNLKAEVDPFNKQNQLNQSQNNSKNRHKQMTTSTQKLSFIEGQLIAEESEDSTQQQNSQTSSKSNHQQNNIFSKDAQRKQTLQDQILLAAKYESSDDANENDYQDELDKSNENSDITDDQIFQHNSEQQQIFDQVQNDGAPFRQQTIEDFDLQQYQFTTKLDIKMENPIIVLKDRPYFEKNIEIDLGQIQICSYLKNIEGKWKNHPKKKTYVNIIETDMRDVRIDYNSKQFCITPPFDMMISYERINWSELLLDYYMSYGIDFEEFDLSDKIVIKSTALKFNFEKEIYTYFLQMLDLNINYYDMLAPGYQLFTWNSLDFMKYLDIEDQTVEKFKDKNVQRRAIVFQFPSLSLTINERNNLNSPDNNKSRNSDLMTELVLQNMQIDFKHYLDYRKDIQIKANTFYILYKDGQSNHLQQTHNQIQEDKCLIIGPMKSKRAIQTLNSFYNLNFDRNQFFASHMKSKNQSIMHEVYNKELENSDFELIIKMEADGAKIFEYQLKSLKLFLKVDILQIISNFFSNNWPEYPSDSIDVPTYHETDIGNYPRYEMVVNLNDCLICFEQMSDLQDLENKLEIKTNKVQMVIDKQNLNQIDQVQDNQSSSMKKIKVTQSGQKTGSKNQKQKGESNQENKDKNFGFFSKTIAFQGKLQYHYIREKANQIKKSLIDVPSSSPQKITNLNNQGSILSQGIGQISNQDKLATQQIHILDFQPFFCDIKDLIKGGISLNHILKRQMITPFNLYFNQNDIIELNTKKIKNLKKQHMRLQIKNKNLELRQSLLDKEKQEMLNDENFTFYKKSEINLDMAQIQLSFNDLISLKGISMKLANMNQNFVEYMQRFDEAKKLDKQNDEKGKNDKPQDIDVDQVEVDNVNEPFKINPVIKSAQWNSIQNKQMNKQLKENDDLQINDVIDDCEANIDETEEEISFQQLRRNIDLKQQKEQQQNPHKRLTRVQQISMNPLIVTEQEIQNSLQTQILTDLQNKGIDQIQIVSHGLKFILINDRDNNFLPVLSNNFSHFTVHWDLNQKQQCIWTDINCSFNFFNVNVGVWEPFIEPFNFKLMLNEETSAQNKNLQCNVNTPLNINFTEKLVENLYESQNSWKIVEKNFNNFYEQNKLVELNQLSKDNQIQNVFLHAQDQQTKLQDQYKQIIINDNNLNNQNIIMHSQENKISQLYNNQNIINQLNLQQAKDSQTNDKYNQSYMVNAQFDARTQTSNFGSIMDPKFNEEIITPYVLVNKTDMSLTIKRLIEKDKVIQIQQQARLQGRSNQSSNRKNLINIYQLKQGQIIDYMVDYSQDKTVHETTGHQVTEQDDMQSVYNTNSVSGGRTSQFAAENDQKVMLINQMGDETENIHLDTIGEYKSEYVRIQFQIDLNERVKNEKNFEENKEIKKIDLNELGLKMHTLREGKFQEQIYYGVQLVDFKKIFTIRTQFQLVNKTCMHYLVHFKLKDRSIVKFLEAGESLPLAMRMDESKIQIKMISQKSNDLKEQQRRFEFDPNQTDGKIERQIFQEELLAREQQVYDFKDQSLGFSDWSSLIPLIVLKYKLKFNEGSYLKNNISKFTFIRKQRADIDRKKNIIDINLMTPLIVKNCLPVPFTLSYLDSSNVQKQQYFDVNQETNIYCFSLADTIKVDLLIKGFEPKQNFKIFNLGRYRELENKIEIENSQGLKTLVYSQISRRMAGQRVVIYAKKLLIDQIDSQLTYYYLPPKKTTRSKDDNLDLVDPHTIPYVELVHSHQKVFIIPEGFSEVHATMDNCLNKELQKIDVETPTTQVEFKIQTQIQTFNFSYTTNIYLATKNEYVYSKITTVNPYYIFINNSNYTILVEQAEMRNSINNNVPVNQMMPLIIGPNQKQAFFYYNINTQIPGIDEFIHIKLLDEEITAQDLQELVQEYQKKYKNNQMLNQASQSTISSSEQSKSSRYSSVFSQVYMGIGSQQKREMIFTKQYNWSTPFMCSEVDTFSLKINPRIRKQRLLEQMNGLNIQERILLTKIMNEPKFIKLKCKADLKQAPGSMCIILEEEDEDTCQYKIVNKTTVADIIYNQHIVNNPVWNKRLFAHDGMTQKCKVAQTQRFTWESILHQKLLRVSFQMRGRQGMDYDKMELTDIQKDQEFRVIANQNKRFTDILIPFDKIGHSEEVTLIPEMDINNPMTHKTQNSSFHYKLKLSIMTNGFTKFLEISDACDDSRVKASSEKEKNSCAKTTFNIINNSDNEIEAKMRMIDLSIQKIMLSVIHKKSELMTVFVNKLNMHLTETEKQKQIKFSVGYLQIDNQSEHDPVYPVMLCPRDLYYNQETDAVIFRVAELLEQDKHDKTKQKQFQVQEQDANMFQFQMVINNQSSELNDKKDILFIEHIAFLLQTLNIKVQFSHFLKLTTFIQHIGKILNQSVNEVHYIFEEGPQIGNRQAEFDLLQVNSGYVGSDESDNQSLLKMLQSLEIKQMESSEQLSERQQKNQLFIYASQSGNKQDRLKKFAKHEFQSHSSTSILHSQNKIEAVIMKKEENNWRYSQESSFKSEWRLFIREYQSSPTDLVVSAINTRLSKASDATKIDSNATSQSQHEIDQRVLMEQKYMGSLPLYDFEDDDNERIQEEGAIQILGALGEVVARRILYFSTFEDMNFKMNGINASNLFGEGNEVMNHLANYHKEQFKYNAFMLIGSSNLIGNPSRFINNIGTGVSDFFYKPYQGLKEGSIVKVKDGFADGTKSFVQNSLMAPVGAVAKIGQSLSKGALALSFDDKFIEAKNFNEQRNKPTSIGDGMKKGLSSAGNSIYSGVTGVFTKPMEGARNNGIIGFFKGGAKGAAGFVSKTTSGMIDIIAKTSEGLDNQSKSLQKYQTIRVRRPRTFYTAYNIIKPYNEFHSFWIDMIQQQNEQLNLQRIYEIFLINEDTKFYFDQEIDQTLIAGLPKSSLISFKEEEHKQSIFAITKTQIIEVTSVVQLLRNIRQVKDRKNQDNQNKEGAEEGQALETDCYESLLEQQDESLQEIIRKKNQLLISNVYKIINIVNIEITGDDHNILVIKFLPKQTTDQPNQSDKTKSQPEQLNPRMQQAINTKQQLAAARNNDIAFDSSPQVVITKDEVQGTERMQYRGSFLAPRSQAKQTIYNRSSVDIHSIRSEKGSNTQRNIHLKQRDNTNDSPFKKSKTVLEPDQNPTSCIQSLPMSSDGQISIANQNQQLLVDKVKEKLVLNNLLGSQRVFSSSDYLQIDFDSSTRAKEVMTLINKIRLLLTREMLSQNNLI